MTAPLPRLVIIGRNSRLWRAVEALDVTPQQPYVALGHGDLTSASFGPSDVIWILSYAASEAQNCQLMSRLKSCGAERVVYVSTATAPVAEMTRCYGYPKIKLFCERSARLLLNAQICRIGLVYRDPDELPSGISAATSYAAFVAAMEQSRLCVAPEGDEIWHLYELVTRPFATAGERLLFQGYGRLMELAKSSPCILRPIDFALRLLGFRWYGYVYLGNKLCKLTTSSSAQD